MWVFRTLQRYQKQIYTAPRRDSKQAEVLNKQKARQQLMQSKLYAQERNIDSNTPRIVSGIVAFLTLPSFYYAYTMMSTNYEDVTFYESIRKSIDWINMKASLTCGMLLGLEFMQFSDFRAKNVIATRTQRGLVLITLPLLMGLISYSGIETLNPWLIVPSTVNVFGTLAIFSMSANFGTVPFWNFSLFYQMFAVDIVLLSILFFAMRNLRKHRERKPALYMQ